MGTTAKTRQERTNTYALDRRWVPGVICTYCGTAGHTRGQCVARLRDEAEAKAQAALETV